MTFQRYLEPNPASMQEHYKSRWWESQPGNRVKCLLCPRYCNIPEGSHGFCTVRKNSNGSLMTAAYGRSTGFALDPIEKKPLYHFYPGSNVLSFGTSGCNLGCKFCQNWHISKTLHPHYDAQIYTPKDVITIAKRSNSLGIAYTYNEPIIFGEWVMDIANSAKDNRLKNVLVTNGYISKKAREDVFQSIDATNVDLKSISDHFYQKLILSHIEPVLDTLRWLVHETKVWVEITILVIPGENDGKDEFKELSRFIADELNTDIPLHFSAFHPDFRMLNHSPTPVQTLIRARDIALAEGMHYVYLGNVPSFDASYTVCPKCNNSIITRSFYSVLHTSMDGNHCQYCQTVIPGHFNKGGFS